MSTIESIMWGVAAFAMTVAIVWASNPFAHRWGLIDHPTGRKDHGVPTPVTGGIAMLFAVLTCSALALGPPGSGSLGFALAATILVVMGVLDDRFDLPWWLRMLVQVGAALVLVHVGDVRIERLGSMFGFEIASLGVWTVPFTVFALVGAINAVNMADGIDGLAGVLVLSCLIALDIEAFAAGDAAIVARMPILIGAVGGFVLLNLRRPGQPRARIFMGNSGSAFLGLAIACFASRLTQNPQNSVDPVLALWLLPVPLVDCLVLMLRRLRHGRSPFCADQNHIHHLMREAGFGPTRTVLVLGAFSLVAWLVAHVVLRLGAPPVALFGAFVCLCLLWFWITSRRARAIGMFRFLRSPFAYRTHPVAAQTE